MKKRVFIIHGWGGFPGEGWMAWIKKELEKRDFEVVDPQMPNTNYPKMKEWIPKLAELVGEVDENTYFIGHSMGTQTIMRYLETIYPQKVGGAVLVAGFFDIMNLTTKEDKQIARPWIETPIALEKVKEIGGKFRVLLSDDDEWVGLDKNKKIFEEKLGAEVVIKEKMGHFNENSEIPEILEFFEKL